MMKRNLLLLIMLMLTHFVAGQSMKYKEIYPMIEAQNYRQAVPYLLEFLAYEPDHPSANLQLALIYEQRFKTYHPILKYRPAIKNAEEAKIRFLKARLLIDEREIRRNGKKYYTNFATYDHRGKPDVEYATVRLTIDSAYIDIDQFLRLVPGIYEKFTESVRYYDQATKRFARINDEYTSMKDIYLRYDATLASSLRQLKNDYDSSLYFFKAYLDASAEYPVTEHEQTYEIRPIQHYRLDGLNSQDDFLAPKIVFWDYGTWVDQVDKMINGEIAALRRQIELNEQKLNEQLQVLASPSSAIQADISPIEVDRELILKLRNYDFYTMVLPLLQYKETKANLLYRSLLEFDMAEDTAMSGSYQTLLIYFSQMFHNALAADSLIGEVEKRNTRAQMERHEDYIESYYYGADGLTSFIEKEDRFSERKINEYSGQILKNLIAYSDDRRDSLYAEAGRNERIPLFRDLPDSIQVPEGRYFTARVQEAPDSSRFVSGVFRDDETAGVHVFLSRVDPELNPMWIKLIQLDTLSLDSLFQQPTASTDSTGAKAGVRIFDNLPGAMEITAEGVALVMSSIERNTGKMYNTFLLLDEEGEEVFRHILPVHAMARKILYNDQSNSYILAFKGAGPRTVTDTVEELTLVRADMQGEPRWTTSIAFAGDLREVLMIEGGYLVAGNFMIFPVEGSGMSAVGSSATGPKDSPAGTYLFHVDIRGEIMDRKLIRPGSSFYAERVIKINDECINILGLTGPWQEGSVDLVDQESDPVHIIINANLRVLHANTEL